jgi:prepilin-type N-terminal cleavage/methylation domain-containing protein
MSARLSPVFAATPIRPSPGRRGFSLLEVLLAVSLSAMLLVAVNFFVLSLGELWSGGSEPRLFDRHVRGVARFLDSLVQQSVVPEQDTKRPASGAPPQARSVPRHAAPVAAVESPAPRTGLAALAAAARLRISETLGAAGGLRLGVAPGGRALRILVQAPGRNLGGVGRLPPGVRDADAKHPPTGGAAGGRADSRNGNAVFATTGSRFSLGTPAGYDGAPPMLMFEIDEAPGQCVWPERPLPQVECALQVNADEGLVLLWKSKLEEDYGTARPRKTQLSPFARGISYDYFDSDRQEWTHTEQPQSDGNGGWLVPQRIRVAFAYQGLEREISIVLPDVPEGVPLR